MNDGNGDGGRGGNGEPDSGWSRRGDWTRLNRYEVIPPPSDVDAFVAAGPAHTGFADDYHVTLRCRLDMAALRYLAERADLLGLEIIEVRPAVADGGHDG